MALEEANFTQAEFSLSVESVYRESSNVSFVTNFLRKADEDDDRLSLGPKEVFSHTETISLPWRVSDLHLVKFYSKSTSTSTFKGAKITFDPIYIARVWERRLKTRSFCPFTVDTFEHNTWNTLEWECY